MVDGGSDERARMGHPWLIVIAALVAASVVTTAVSDHGTESAAYALGANMGKMVLPALILGIVLRRSSMQWWLGLLIATILFLGLLGTAGAISAARQAADRGQTDQQAPAGADARAVRLPERVAEWRRADDRRSRQVVAQAGRQLEDAPAGMITGSPVLGLYLRASDSAFLLAYDVGDDLAAELRDDPVQGAVDYVAGATGDDSPQSADPGPLGGGMACTDQGKVIEGGVFCGWADAGTAGQVELKASGLTIEEAAGIAQQFREAVTTTDGG